ncbi:nucleoside hydrolase [Corynebacterium stationis]|uniref:nucleoside hydrolase n=1 Tax=Corynebacterium stationis TaxID=1705 RepID=UPI0017580A0C|nr:nucleoside hydrolase [Corynebacterium stationis]HHT60095.1 nucleoside hydrolase [Corynebacterium stationis]
MIPVLIDCDTGIDDALALIYLAALHHEGEVKLVGATTTAGNVDVQQTAVNTRWVLDKCGLGNVPVVVGEPVPLQVPLTTTPETHGEFGLGYTNPGAQDISRDSWQDIWRKAIDQYADLQLIVTGPATNLATFGHVQNTTLMGGSYLYPGNTTPTAEWNTWVDPHGAKQAFAQAKDPITVCSLGVTERFTINPQTLNTLTDALGNTPIASHLPEMLRFYFEFHDSQGEGYLAQIHDLLTVMIALGKIPFSTRKVTVDVEADSELMRGTTVADLRGHWARKANALLVDDVDVDAAHAELLRAAILLNRFASEVT